MQHPDSTLFVLFISIVVAIGNVYLLCYFGKLATESFQNMSGCIYNSNWQQLDIDLKKYIILMVRSSRRPLIFHGYGMLILNLETFTQVSEQFFANLSKWNCFINDQGDFFWYFSVDQKYFFILHAIKNFNTLTNIFRRRKLERHIW